jgi:cell division protease FtsH
MIARTPKSESESGGRCCWLPRQEREQTFVESSLSFGENCNFSDRTAELIDDEVAQLIERNYRRVKEILSHRRAALERVALELHVRETIGREQLERYVAESEAVSKPAVA